MATPCSKRMVFIEKFYLYVVKSKLWNTIFMSSIIQRNAILCVNDEIYICNDWRQEEKGTTEDEMVGMHHRLNGHEFEQAPGDGDGQGSLACCSPWGPKESDKTGWLNNTWWETGHGRDWLAVHQIHLPASQVQS